MYAKPLRFLSAAAGAAGILTYARYRRDIGRRREAVDRGSTIAETAVGDVEYAETGEGEPMFVIHGAGGGYDQGLLIASDFGRNHRVIAPSRFGYLKTPVPQDASPPAQADAHAALLDILGIKRTIVIAASAGAPSAIEMALRHPKRVSALILLAPRTYHPTQSVGADESVPSQTVLRLIEQSADFLLWVAMRVSRGSVVRFLGVPPELEAKACEADRARVTELMNSLLPLSARVRGIEVDSLTKMSPWPLDRIVLPTLIISAEDDLYRTLPGARFTAGRIPGAELEVLPTGGHLMVGQTEHVHLLISNFLEDGRTAKPQPSRPKTKHAQLEPVSA
jgi:pimeloyl-ACP methyl ester carboxylesterase